MTAREAVQGVLGVLADGYPEAGRTGDSSVAPLLSFDELLLAMYPNFGRLEIVLAKDEALRDAQGVLHAERRTA